MLPSVASPETVSRQILAYTVVVVALSLLFGPVAGLGVIYLVSATILGVAFVVLAARLMVDGSSAVAMRLFTYSITYITLLFGAMAADALIG